MQNNGILKRLLMLLALISALMSVQATEVEYLTLNVVGNPVVIALAEHPIITYTDNTLHIQTTTETVDVPIDQITDISFLGTTSIKTVTNPQFQMEAGNICFQQLPKGSKVSVFDINGIVALSSIVDDTGKTVINICSLPKGVYVVKSSKQSFKIANK